MSRLQASVNCDMGEGYSLYSMGDDEAMMKTIHLANIACGFHASDFSIMDKTVALAKANGVAIGAHPSFPDHQGFGRREMKMDASEVEACLIYQVGALHGFLLKHGVSMNHIKPHGALYGMAAREQDTAEACVRVAKLFNVPFMGLAGTCHQKACQDAGVEFLAEWFADLDYSPEGKLLITKKHVPVELAEVRSRTERLLNEGLITTVGGTKPLGKDVTNVSICCHSDTPDAFKIASEVKTIVDKFNQSN